MKTLILGNQGNHLTGKRSQPCLFIEGWNITLIEFTFSWAERYKRYKFIYQGRIKEINTLVEIANKQGDERCYEQTSKGYKFPEIGAIFDKLNKKTAIQKQFLSLDFIE